MIFLVQAFLCSKSQCSRLEMAKAKRPVRRGTHAVLPDTADDVCNALGRANKINVTAGGTMPRWPTCNDSHSCSNKKFHDALQCNPAGREYTSENACNAAGTLRHHTVLMGLRCAAQVGDRKVQSRKTLCSPAQPLLVEALTKPESLNIIQDITVVQALCARPPRPESDLWQNVH